MPTDRRLILNLTAALIAAWDGAASAAPRLSPLFADHAVIQRERDIHISGTATPGEKVLVTLSGNEAAAETDKSGRWTAVLAPMKAGGPHRLEAGGRAVCVAH